MPFPARRVPILLTATTPTEFTVDALKKQLTDIGLTCSEADKDKLTEYLQEFDTSIPVGSVETFGMMKPALPGESKLEGFVGAYVQSSIGNYEPDSTGLGYATDLEYIQYPTHFDWLVSNQPGFAGMKNDPPESKGQFGTVDAIKTMFIDVATTASASLIKGLDKESIQSVFSNAISTLTDRNAEDYRPGPQSRVIFLVDGYNPKTNAADSIGVLTVTWDLTIQNYQKKKMNSPLLHETTLSVHTRSVLYSSLDTLANDKLAVQTQFKENAFQDIPARPTVVKIFDALPPADAATFKQSLPLVATENTLEAVVLYAPNLQNIGSIDNTLSDTTTIYTESVTSGFTFSTAQELGLEAVFSADAIIAKASISVTLTFTFTEEWSKSTTESMSFSVPPGKKAFTYQGYLMAKHIVYDAQSGTFKYGTGARMLSNVLVTTAAPVLDAG